MLDLTEKKLLNKQDSGWLDLAANSNMSEVKKLIILKDKLRNRYKDYDEIIKDYSTPPKESEFIESKRLLNSAYGTPPANLKKEILTLRQNHGFLQCPFCGRPVKTRILDHFIPKNKWPEFSIYPNNLVQQCDSCSSKKGQQFYCNESSIVKYIHPKYFDLLSRVQISISIDIIDELNLSNVILRPEFKVIGKTSNIEKTRIRAHIKNLEISDAIESYTYTKYNDIIGEASKKKTNYKVLLRELISHLSRHDVTSNWEVALYKAMLRHPKIVEFFELNKPEENVINTADFDGDDLFG
ncbi:HNH endonuclease [Vibrio alginolyticus]|uniref:HNH endonuclease n=1 Tax=Vibrio alginolyticus TaxID=663 RepID=UPI0011ED4A8F|nr:HNH endonuclease [Vibrio alginolyticus]TYZ37403.1 hypothetical protein EWT61_06795 [Vibrio alginolyticus]